MAETLDLSESRQTEVLIVAWVTTGAAILAVGIKLFARAKIIHVIGWDDFLIFLSLVRSVATSSNVTEDSQLTILDIQHHRFVFRALWSGLGIWSTYSSCCRRIWQ
jgi:hypothetical protein